MKDQQDISVEQKKKDQKLRVTEFNNYIASVLNAVGIKYRRIDFEKRKK